MRALTQPERCDARPDEHLCWPGEGADIGVEPGADPRADQGAVRGPVPGYGWADARAPASCGYLVDPVLRELARLGARRVVDIGAGNGAMAGRLAAAGLDLTGVEPDAGGVAAARAAWPDIVFEQAGVADDPAPIVERAGGPFDAAVCTEVVEHLYAPARLPRFAAGLLREGGHLIVTTPYHGYLKNLLLALAGCWDRHHTALWEGGHIKFWSQATLSALLEDNGFAVVRFRGAGRLPWVWKSMLLSARKTP